MRILAIQPFLKGYSISPIAGGKDKAALETCRSLVSSGHSVDILPLPWGLEKKNNDIICNPTPVLLSPDGLQAKLLPTFTFPSPSEARSLLWKFLRTKRSYHHTYVSARDILWRAFSDKKRSIRSALENASYDAILVSQTGSDIPSIAKQLGFKGKLILVHHSSGRSSFIPQYDHTIFVSNSQFNYALSLYPQIGKKSTTIHCFADTSCFRKTDCKAKPAITFIGILDSKRKGLDILLESYRRTPALSSIKLNIVGEGPLLDEFKSFASRHKIPAHFHGKISAEGNAKLLSESGAYVMPSRAEGLALTYIESLCMGVPIIGFPPNVNELSTLLKQPVGFAFQADSDTPESLASKILDLTNEKSSISNESRKQISIDARDRFSLDSFHQNYLSTIERIVS